MNHCSPIQGTRSYKMEDYSTYLSPSFNKNQDILLWIEEQQFFDLRVQLNLLVTVVDYHTPCFN